MDLFLFIVLLALALILITIGLFRPEHTEMALIGFVFLFLLSITLETGAIDYKIGVDTNFTYNIDGQIELEQSRDIYDSFNLTGAISHLLGFWLGIASVIGFVGVLLGLRAQRFR